MREHVYCPGCSTKGKVRIIHSMPVVFWKRDDLTWWRDNLSLADLEQGSLCGYCGVPSQTLKWNGWAQRKKGTR